MGAAPLVWGSVPDCRALATERVIFGRIDGPILASAWHIGALFSD